LASGLNAAEEMLAYARGHNATKIVVGKPTHSRWRDKLFGSTLDRLVRGSGEIDVYIITGDVDAARGVPAPRAGRPSPLGEYVRAGLVVAACAAISLPLLTVLSVTDVAMIFLLGVVFVASRYGRGPSVFASLLSIATFDFLFVPPRFTFAVSDVRYALTFGVMLAAALVASHLTLRIRAQAQTARERERRTGAVYAMSRELAAARMPAEVLAIATRHLADTWRRDATDSNQAGRLEGGPLDEKERSVAQWVFDHGQRASAGTDTLPSASGLYVPLAASTGLIGVLGVRVADPARFEDPVVLDQLETFAAQAALALERAQLADRAQKEEVEVEAERLRTSLLSSLSHDMRTPLAAMTGAASSLLEEPGKERSQTPPGASCCTDRRRGEPDEPPHRQSAGHDPGRERRAEGVRQPLEEPVGVALTPGAPAGSSCPGAAAAGPAARPHGWRPDRAGVRQSAGERGQHTPAGTPSRSPPSESTVGCASWPIAARYRRERKPASSTSSRRGRRGRRGAPGWGSRFVAASSPPTVGASGRKPARRRRGVPLYPSAQRPPGSPPRSKLAQWPSRLR
jgi:signal transduction histidine kinase